MNDASLSVITMNILLIARCLAADQLGMDAVLIEQSADYADDARRKLTADAGLFARVAAE